MQRGKEPSSFRIVRIKCEQLFQRSGRPAVLAGVHVGDGFLEKRAFLAVADNTPVVNSGMSLFVSFLRGFLVGPHFTTLADHRKIPSGSPGLFAPDFVSVRFLTILRGRQTRRRNAILVPLQSLRRILMLFIIQMLDESFPFLLLSLSQK